MLTLINNRVVTPEDFILWRDACQLTDVGRKKFFAAYEQRPLHLLHVSARESVAELRAARAAGVDGTGEATPHHLCLTDDAVRSLDSNLKMNPPLRTGDDRSAQGRDEQ